jgi:hypothetical protein
MKNKDLTYVKFHGLLDICGLFHLLSESDTNSLSCHRIPGGYKKNTSKVSDN